MHNPFLTGYHFSLGWNSYFVFPEIAFVGYSERDLEIECCTDPSLLEGIVKRMISDADLIDREIAQRNLTRFPINPRKVYSLIKQISSKDSSALLSLFDLERIARAFHEI
jgi:hypothetical protein